MQWTAGPGRANGGPGRYFVAYFERDTALETFSKGGTFVTEAEKR